MLHSPGHRLNCNTIQLMLAPRMSEPNYLKCHCQNCRNSIEFPAAGLGQTTTCPHCGQLTVLVADAGDAAETPSAPTRKSRDKFVGMVAGVLILASATVGVMVLRNRTAQNATNEEAKSKAEAAATSFSTSPKTAEGEPAAPPTPSAPKSISDLKSGPITLEKAKGSSLVYAVGILRNDSVHQRFGVNIELELTDARGNKAGKAKDYRAVLEPRQEWRFRALILDSKAVAAKVSSIREE